MHINVHWGNLDRESHASQFNHILDKNIDKLKRIISKLDDTSIRIDFFLKYDSINKRFKTVVHFVTPKSNHHVTERGFTLEESMNKSVANLRRKFRKSKEKKITLNRKRIQ